MSKELPYETIFADLIVKPLVSEEKDKYLAMASLIEVKKFIPLIDTSVNLDILPVAFNACVINRVNKNRDVVDTSTALAMYKHFISKPINVEHNRQRVIGVILTAGFSEFGSDRALTEEQVSGMTAPFNITLGGIVWRVVCPELSDHIEESGDPTSDKYLSVSASWELGFSDYRVALLEAGVKNLAEAKRIISDPSEIEKVRDSLTSLGGDGKVNDLFAYRMPSASVLPLGIGFTEKPAAEVKGVATPEKDPLLKPVNVPQPAQNNKVGIIIPEAFGGNDTIDPQKNEIKISQSIKIDVNKGRKVIMKITSIKDITDESLKECSASAISEFISTELKKGNDEWVAEKSKLDTLLAQAKSDGQKLQEAQSKLQEELTKVQATVEALNTEKSEREKVEKFNVRMSELNEVYDLDDEVRAAIVEDIKALASDEGWAKWQTKAKALLKGFAKKKEDKKDDKKDDKMSDKKDDKGCKGSVSDALDKAVDNGSLEKGGLPNGSSAASADLKEKYQAAFAMEQFVITR